MWFYRKGEENILDETCEQRLSFKENGNENATYTDNKKETKIQISRALYDERELGEFDIRSTS